MSERGPKDLTFRQAFGQALKKKFRGTPEVHQAEEEKVDKGLGMLLEAIEQLPETSDETEKMVNKIIEGQDGFSNRT